MNIEVFTAGGTIDKIYGEEKGTLNFTFGTPAVKEIGENKPPFLSMANSCE